jgi:broad specificity phosphatase PhoE
MTQIVLIRPGQTDYAADSRLLGMLEMPINKAGMQEVQEVLKLIAAADLRRFVLRKVKASRRLVNGSPGSSTRPSVSMKSSR